MAQYGTSTYERGLAQRRPAIQQRLRGEDPGNPRRMTTQEILDEMGLLANADRRQAGQAEIAPPAFRGGPLAFLKEPLAFLNGPLNEPLKEPLNGPLKEPLVPGDTLRPGPLAFLKDSDPLDFQKPFQPPPPRTAAGDVDALLTQRSPLQTRQNREAGILGPRVGEAPWTPQVAPPRMPFFEAPTAKEIAAHNQRREQNGQAPLAIPVQGSGHVPKFGETSRSGLTAKQWGVRHTPESRAQLVETQEALRSHREASNTERLRKAGENAAALAGIKALREGRRPQPGLALGEDLLAGILGGGPAPIPGVASPVGVGVPAPGVASVPVADTNEQIKGFVEKAMTTFVRSPQRAKEYFRQKGVTDEALTKFYESVAGYETGLFDRAAGDLFGYAASEKRMAAFLRQVLGVPEPRVVDPDFTGFGT